MLQHVVFKGFDLCWCAGSLLVKAI